MVEVKIIALPTGVCPEKRLAEKGSLKEPVVPKWELLCGALQGLECSRPNQSARRVSVQSRDFFLGDGLGIRHFARRVSVHFDLNIKVCTSCRKYACKDFEFFCSRLCTPGHLAF